MGILSRGLLQFFDKLLWISIQSSVLIILIVLLQKVLRGRLGIRWHYLLWFLLLIRLAMPWLPESKMSIFNLIPRSIQQGRLIESFTETQNVPGMGFYLYDESTDNQEAQQKEGGFKAFFVGFVRKLPLLWLAGVLIMAGFVCVRNISLWLTVKRERPITDQEILDLLEDCKMEMGIQTIIGVVVSERIKSPALFGFVRPRLLLPQGLLETYSLDELRYVFVHELAHLKQRDIYFGWLMALLQIAHWFNPLMWFAFGRMRADRELACDGLAISMMDADEPPRYGQTIVNLLENFSQVRYVPSVAGILEDKSQIERRIKIIAKFKKTSRSQWAGAMLLLAALACVVLTNAYMAKADFTFSIPMNLGPTINTSPGDVCPSISSDGLTLYFAREDGNIWIAKRTIVNNDWDTASNLGQVVNSPYVDGGPCISADGLELYFVSDRPDGSGGPDIWVTNRATLDDNWGTPINLGTTINSASMDVGQSLSADGLQLYFSSNRPGGFGDYDLYVSTRSTKDDPWVPPVNLGSTLNSSSSDEFPNISADSLFLFFASNRPGGYGGRDLLVTKRATKDDPWDEPVNLGANINCSEWDFSPSLSADGQSLFFCSARPGGFGSFDIWQVSILPVVDFNADGFVDSVDICMMLDYWHTDEPLYDIAPMPFGDGIVDVKDLVLLAEHLTIKADDSNETNMP